MALHERAVRHRRLPFREVGAVKGLFSKQTVCFLKSFLTAWPIGEMASRFFLSHKFTKNVLF